MGSLTMTSRVEAPPGAVFDIFTDLDRAAERIRGIVSIQKLTDGPVGRGTRFRETRKVFKKEASEEMEITEFEPGRSYTVGSESCGCRYATTFNFVPEGASATRVEVEFRYHPVTFVARVMSPLGKLMMGPVMKKCLEQDLADLKAVAEAGVPAPA